MPGVSPLNKKIIIILAAVVSVLTAAAAAALLIHGLKEKLPVISSSISSQSKLSSEISSLPEASEPEDTSPQLVITSPSKLNSTTTASVAVIKGSSDPAEKLLLNGAELNRNPDGSFAYETKLNIGKNSFVFEHKGKKTTCNITYRYVVINAYSPNAAQKYSSGATFAVVAAARPGSKVTATFAGNTIPLNQNQAAEEGFEFVNYSGSFTLPDDNVDNLSLGKVKFTATFGGITESFYSGNITCLKNDILANSPLIAEVVAYSAETFNGSSADDCSRPTNNYLPKGTVDYCDRALIHNGSHTYARLRCGRRVYTEALNKPDPSGQKQAVIRRYHGTLPDHNEITFASFSSEGRHSVLTVNTMWKAPFFFELLPQRYTDPSKQDYTIDSATYEYIDITFLYATQYTGNVKIQQNHPTFKSAEIRRSGNNTVLRLYLKAKGIFYGWDCRYNENGQLVFEFLNPKNTAPAANKYGIDFNGAVILIDAGHGGIDPGAEGTDGSTEANRNLNLARLLKAELTAAGATVHMTRSSDVNVKYEERRKLLKALKPDYCIALHHDASDYPSANGYSVFYSQPFSMAAARSVYNRTHDANIYSKAREPGWHYFFLAQMTACPVVLTENGFMSSPVDIKGIQSSDISLKKVEAMVRGIADYFNSIRYEEVAPEPPTEPEPPSEQPVDPPIEPETPSLPEETVPESDGSAQEATN